jgi:heterodisulfide reductase subunit A-like polyferredoxin
VKRSAEVFDVAIIGGGSAGIAAALAAAREGGRTLLVERQGYLGGMGTASLVHTFCGLYLLRDEPGAVFANPGIGPEIVTRMISSTCL